MKIEIVCKKCDYKPKPNKDKSNKNWQVYDMKCQKCGNQMQITAGGDTT